MTWVWIIWNYAQRLNYKRIRKREFLIAQAFGLRGREKKPPGDVWQFILFFGATFLPGIENEKKKVHECIVLVLGWFILYFDTSEGESFSMFLFVFFQKDAQDIYKL